MTSTPFVWVIFDFGGVLLTMKDRQSYNDGMKHVLDVLRDDQAPLATSGFDNKESDSFRSALSVQSSIDASSPLTPPRGAVQPGTTPLPLPSTTAELKKRVYSGPEFLRAKVGMCTSDEMWSSLFHSYQPHLSMDKVREMRDLVRLNGRHVDPQLVALLEDLRQNPNIGLAVLSNYESDLRPVLEGLGILQYFIHSGEAAAASGVKARRRADTVFNSCELGFAKPNPDCYLQTVEALRDEMMFRSRPGRSDVSFVFIDDKEPNVVASTACGAVQVGITFHDAAQCVKDVREALDGLQKGSL